MRSIGAEDKLSAEALDSRLPGGTFGALPKTRGVGLEKKGLSASITPVP